MLMTMMAQNAKAIVVRLPPLLSFSGCNGGTSLVGRRRMTTLTMTRHGQQQQQQLNSYMMASAATFASASTRSATVPPPPPSPFSRGLRRRRQYEGKIPVQGNNNPPNKFVVAPEKLQLDAASSPFEHGEASMEAYLKKTSLSHWVPVPEVVARKLFDLANATVEDVHVDLGSGDGRVNFLAVDYARVRKSLGVDVDETIVQVANERRSKRHPLPKNLTFSVGNLLDPTDPVWDEILQIEPTILTMFFAQEALQKFRHILEHKLVGRTCKILTVGYEMPGWEATTQEVVLGTQIHLYQWGGSSSSNMLDNNQQEEDDLFSFDGDDLIKEKPEAFHRRQHALEGDKFQGSQVVDRTGQYPIRGFNPDIFDEEEDDSDWEDDEEEEEEPGEAKDSRS